MRRHVRVADYRTLQLENVGTVSKGVHKSTVVPVSR